MDQADRKKILSKDERKRLLQEHEEESVQKLREMKAEVLQELADIEVALMDRGACMGDAVLYIGCHTRLKEGESPKYKMEVLLDVDCYKRALWIVRGLQENAKTLIRLPEQIDRR